MIEPTPQLDKRNGTFAPLRPNISMTPIERWQADLWKRCGLVIKNILPKGPLRHALHKDENDSLLTSACGPDFLNTHRHIHKHASHKHALPAQGCSVEILDIHVSRTLAVHTPHGIVVLPWVWKTDNSKNGLDNVIKTLPWLDTDNADELFERSQNALTWKTQQLWWEHKPTPETQAFLTKVVETIEDTQAKTWNVSYKNGVQVMGRHPLRTGKISGLEVSFRGNTNALPKGFCSSLCAKVIETLQEPDFPVPIQEQMHWNTGTFGQKQTLITTQTGKDPFENMSQHQKIRFHLWLKTFEERLDREGVFS